MSLAEQITRIYLDEETWHKTKLDEADANAYHKILLRRGNIITVCDADKLLGYCEFWKLNYEQFGRIICGEPFSAIHEDVQTGFIAYVANTFILPEHRQGNVYKMLRDRFFESNEACSFFVGEARRKKSCPIKVFRKEDIMKFKKVEV